MAGLGWQELTIVLVIIMIFFGAGKLPDIAKSLGQGVKEFRAEAESSEAPRASSVAAVTPPTAPSAAAERHAIEARDAAEI